MTRPVDYRNAEAGSSIRPGSTKLPRRITAQIPSDPSRVDYPDAP
jgi:hypothetical protein